MKENKKEGGQIMLCANGDGNKVSPPSKVICRECIDKITRNLEKMLEELTSKKGG
ncbi:MAG: hypothetical protein AABY15_08580 [Nanoarchaeota archaeon]